MLHLLAHSPHVHNGQRQAQARSPELLPVNLRSGKAQEFACSLTTFPIVLPETGLASRDLTYYLPCHSADPSIFIIFKKDLLVKFQQTIDIHIILNSEQIIGKFTEPLNTVLNINKTMKQAYDCHLGTLLTRRNKIYIKACKFLQLLTI